MKVDTGVSRDYYVMIDSDNDLVQIDWINGGQIRKAPSPEAVTAWANTDSTREITLQNMRKIMEMNLGFGLRIGRCEVTFVYKEEDVEPTEDKLN